MNNIKRISLKDLGLMNENDRPRRNPPGSFSKYFKKLMIIRKVSNKDILQLDALKGRADTERYLRRIQETIKGKADYLVVEENEEIVGHVFLKYYGSKNNHEYPDIEDLYVRGDIRGKGIGVMLIKECERLVKEQGFNKIGLS